MKKKYFLKNQSGLQRKAIAGGLAATFAFGTVSSGFAGAMKENENIPLGTNNFAGGNTQNKFSKIDDFVVAGGILLEDSDGISYKASDFAFFKNNNAMPSKYNLDASKALNFINKNNFLISLCRGNINAYFQEIKLEIGKIKKIRRCFREKYEQGISMSDIVFGFTTIYFDEFSKAAHGKEMLCYIYNTKYLQAVLKEVYGLEDIVLETEIPRKYFALLLVAAIIIIIIIIWIVATKSSSKIETTESKQTEGNQGSSDDDKKNASKNPDPKSVTTSISSTSEIVGKGVAANLLGALGGVGTKILGEKVSNGKGESKLIANKGFVGNEVAGTGGSTVVGGALDGVNGVAKVGNEVAETGGNPAVGDNSNSVNGVAKVGNEVAETGGNPAVGVNSNSVNGVAKDSTKNDDVIVNNDSKDG